jgi:hypothetical protein
MAANALFGCTGAPGTVWFHAKEPGLERSRKMTGAAFQNRFADLGTPEARERFPSETKARQVGRRLALSRSLLVVADQADTRYRDRRNTDPSKSRKIDFVDLRC